MLPLLEGAQQSVDVLLFKMSASGRVATDALIAAAERGVSVGVMLEHGSFASSDAANEEARTKLEAAGVVVCFDDPAELMLAKVVVVDGEQVLVGSSNWTGFALMYNIEVDVSVRSRELAQELQGAVGRVWVRCDKLTCCSG